MNSCYNFTHRDRQILGLSEAAASAVSAIICSFVILIAVTYNKYRANSQKLLLCLTINLLIYSITHILQGGSYNIIHTNEKYCKALAYIFLTTRLCTRVSILCIVLEAYLCVLLKKDTMKMKWIYSAAVYLIPVSVSWIPFAFHKFGLTEETQCYIKYKKTNCECDHAGLVLMIVIDWLSLGALLIIVVPFYWFLLYRLWQQGKQYTPLVEVTRNTIYQETIKDLGYFKWLTLLLFVINLFIVIATVISIYYISITLLSVRAVMSGLQSGMIIVGILHPKTRKFLNWSNFKTRWHQKIFHATVVETYPIIKAEHGDSVRP